jgi:thiazole synthase ThiGH ThiG subunit
VISDGDQGDAAGEKAGCGHPQPAGCADDAWAVLFVDGATALALARTTAAMLAALHSASGAGARARRADRHQRTNALTH